MVSKGVKMNIVLRLVLIVVSLITAAFVIKKIRKSEFVIQDTLYWIFFTLFVLVLAIFPQISYFFSNLIGFDSPSNFIFVSFIFLLVIKVFLLSVKISRLETKLNHFAQKYAIDHVNLSDKNVSESNSNNDSKQKSDKICEHV